MYLSKADWQTTPYPAELLRHAGMKPQRKLRLFACHCVSRLRGLLTREATWRAVATAERFADGEAELEELRQGWRDTRAALAQSPMGTRWEWALTAVLHTTTEPFGLQDAMTVGRYTALALGGNWPEQPVPGREVEFDKPEETQFQCAVLRDLFPHRPLRLPGELLAWQGGELVRLAEGIYREKRWVDLPILGDALEEAGCEVLALLEHARGGGPHYRGCWLVDALLSKSGRLAKL